MNKSVNTIDITPTWGEWGNVFRRFAETGETRAVRELRSDFAKAMASAQALQVIRTTLTDEQARTAAQAMTAELTKQGY